MSNRSHVETHSEYLVGIPDEEDVLGDIDVSNNVTWKIKL
jgi:hypothetical protein